MKTKGADMVFDWSDDFSVGDEYIDAEHKHLFEVGEEVFKVADNHQHKAEKIKHVVQELYEYMRTHFEHEEAYMQKVGFPGLPDHKVIHQKIIDTMNDFMKDLPKMSISTIEHALAGSIKHWILQHIEQEDKQIGDWLREQGKI